ncbi:hypothetical protein DMA11_18430 [Marinilabiliaceae bacterium JC017]|nr:hypothetical protein DMA11_18430 [Marinilabiliaceae bacterium JC017]
MFHFEPIIRASGVVLWDDSYNFERHNALLTPDRNLRTFMVDKSNRIVQYGNPILNPEVLNEYKKKILECR